MDNYVFELNYIKAKEELANFINNIPNKYGISFILIDEMLNDIKMQVRQAAINDRKSLESILKSSNKEENKIDE
ncbi:MAG: hypothetical protein J6T10_28780 [Methanobrevibacter sp.]|nr:hypothetical protein [Methanobrevibacter sp.]